MATSARAARAWPPLTGGGVESRIGSSPVVWHTFILSVFFLISEPLGVRLLVPAHQVSKERAARGVPKSGGGVAGGGEDGRS
jgi:hypothetical protein